MRKKWLIAIPIILVLSLLCVLMAAIVVVTITRLNSSGGIHINLRLGDTLAEATEESTYSLSDPASLTTLIVDNPCGSVAVSAASVNEVRVSLHKKAWDKDQPSAQAALANLKLSAQQDGNTLRLGVENAAQVCQKLVGVQSEIDFEIQAPATTLVKADTKNGDISLTGLDASSASAPVELRSAFGSVNVDQLTGGLLVETQNGRVVVQEVQSGQQALSLKTTFGDIRLDRSGAAALDIHTENGGVRLDSVKIAAASVIQSSFGDLTWTDGQTQGLSLQSKNGKISLQGLQIAGELNAQTDFGEVNLKQVSAQAYNVTSLNGSITIQGAQGRVKAQSDFGEISLTGADRVDFNLTSKNGSILFQGKLGDGEHQAATQFGNIQLQLGPQAAFDFDLQTKFGKISSDFKTTIQGTPDSTHWVGTVNGGGSQITAETQNGNITLAAK